MALLTMGALNAIGLGSAHDQFLGWKHRRVHLPVIRAIERHVPLGQAIDQLLQGCLIATPTFPVQELACITITSVPDPEFVAFF
jgi:hypothetical protein